MRNVFQWSIWSWIRHLKSSIYALVTWPLAHIYSPSSPLGGREIVHGDEEQQLPAKGSSLTGTVITERAATQRPDNQQLLIIGIFAEVYLLDGKTIRKSPRSESEEDMQPIIREAMIYDMIGAHPRIAECISQGSGQVKHINIKYYRHGDLATYCQKNSITPELQAKWFQQILEALVVIHSFGVIHSDLALRQFFVDDTLNLRLGDFNSSQCAGHPALGYEKASHCLPRDYELPNTEASDIFALGSTLYELVAGRAPYSELNPIESDDPDSIKAHIRRQHAVVDFEIEDRYRKQQFPDVAEVRRGDIILGCWKGRFATAKEALDLYLKA
ncbi:kinase-like protein [Aspergillus indologenus CBS 114.80]|uniref:Kinase-like protein n=1 Tax=Aspergillus indologenus CBS 114.80 TaxID=1450541 RepID=A0A2V5HVG2_9EURO|nr:kinase-like protein [Aspergillus indologenus CBS 114.80]